MKKNIREIKSEIRHYEPPKDIAKTMMTLGRLGFEFSGHGCGINGEDFTLVYLLSKKDPDDYLYVTLSIPRRDCSVAYKDDLIKTRSLSNTLKKARKMIKDLRKRK